MNINHNRKWIKPNIYFIFIYATSINIKLVVYLFIATTLATNDFILSQFIYIHCRASIGVASLALGTLNTFNVGAIKTRSAHYFYFFLAKIMILYSFYSPQTSYFGIHGIFSFLWGNRSPVNRNFVGFFQQYATFIYIS